MRAALIIALLALVLAQEKINYLSDQDHTEPIDVIIEKFAAQQPEIYRKVFLNFINEKLVSWRSTSNEDKVKEQLLFLLTEPSGPLQVNLRQYMHAKLFDKLDMGSLTASLRDQITLKPENFYLTFDIYDLLFD